MFPVKWQLHLTWASPLDMITNFTTKLPFLWITWLEEHVTQHRIHIVTALKPCHDSHYKVIGRVAVHGKGIRKDGILVWQIATSCKVVRWLDRLTGWIGGRCHIIVCECCWSSCKRKYTDICDMERIKLILSFLLTNPRFYSHSLEFCYLGLMAFS